MPAVLRGIHEDPEGALGAIERDQQEAVSAEVAEDEGEHDEAAEETQTTSHILDPRHRNGSLQAV